MERKKHTVTEAEKKDAQIYAEAQTHEAKIYLILGIKSFWSQALGINAIVRIPGQTKQHCIRLRMAEV